MRTILFIFILLSISLSAQDNSAYYFEHHNIELPLNNMGVIADVEVESNPRQMRLDGKNILFSGGFFLSGYANDTLWANGVASSSRNQDYMPGSYKYSEFDSLAMIYVLKKSDKPFGESWQNWKNAVKLGADFYDGDKDGLYNPVDKNSNGKWDTNEDRPDLLGDQTAWCVYKDAVPSESRIFIFVNPKGIEIQQTVFASSINDSFENTIFVRYRIVNSGLVSDILDSVYFGAWSDPDIGYFSDDLAGCDTTINSGFVYQNTPDSIFGQSSPTLLVSLLQGAPIYISDSTFIDKNSNGYFDNDDTPLTKAYANNGLIKGINYFEGAINSTFTSFTNYYSTHFGGNYPDNEFMVKNNLLGLTVQGDTIDACDWDLGEVKNIDCKNINGLFPYSGDPIKGVGWLNTYHDDQMMMLNTGPFQLKKSVPVDIVIAYIIGYYDTNPFFSLKDAKYKARNVRLYFRNNAFESVDEDTVVITPEPVFNFRLEQNYPNPFNPSTIINYTVPSSDVPQNVTLKVYDLLGKVIATLVNEIQPAGNYTAEFSPEGFSSGVYIYILRNGDKYESRKMMLLH